MVVGMAVTIVTGVRSHNSGEQAAAVVAILLARTLPWVATQTGFPSQTKIA
jgi:hypothetical protein